MQWLTEYVSFHEAENSKQKEWHRKMRNVQMFWPSCVQCVESLSQRRSRVVLTNSRHEEGQRDNWPPSLESLNGFYGRTAPYFLLWCFHTYHWGQRRWSHQPLPWSLVHTCWVADVWVCWSEYGLSPSPAGCTQSFPSQTHHPCLKDIIMVISHQ